MSNAIAIANFSEPHWDDAYVGLPANCQKLVKARLRAMRRIHRANRPSEEIAALAREHRHARGWSEGTLQRLWYGFRQEWDWTTLVDKSMAGEDWWACLATQAMPLAFKEWLGTMWAPHQRGKFASAYQKIRKQYEAWRAGDASQKIPGYDAAPPPDRTGMPAGWSYRNLVRIADKHYSLYARKLVRIGSHAAAEETGSVGKTREGLEVGEIYMPDDLKHDFRVLFRGKSSDLRSFNILDVASDCMVQQAFKPTYLNAKGVWEDLTEREMLYTLDALLGNVGYRPKGTTLYVELGTATIRPEFERALDLLTDGAIRVKRSPEGGGPGIAGLNNGKSAGLTTWKAPVESFFNVYHNRCDHMIEFPAQTGSLARVNDPEGLEKMESVDEAVYKASRLLTPERRDLIKFQMLQYEQAVPMLLAVAELINTRRDHNIQGWRKCGHYLPGFRVAPNRPLLDARLIAQLPPAYQEELRIRLAANPDLVGEIAMNPREVFNAGAGALRKFTPSQRALFLAEGPGEEVTVKQGRLAYNCPEVDPDEELSYGPTFRNLRGSEIVLANGEKYLVRVNHFAHRTAWLYDAQGRFLGVAEYYGRSGYKDAEDLQRQYKANAAQVSQWTRDARRSAAPITAAALETARHNAGIIRDSARETANLAAIATAALSQANT